MNRSLKLLFALSLVGCASAEPEAPLPEEEGPLWITIGTDALETAQMALDEGEPGRVLTPIQLAADVAILSYDSKDLVALSELMHVRHNRCGGFMVHDSLKEAQLALRGTKEADLGTQAVTYTIDNAATVNGMLPELSAPRIAQMITDLSAFQNRYYTSSFGVQSSDLIFNTWSQIASAAGRTDITVERFTHTWQQSSIILTIPGSTLATEVVVMGGHQDSIASGGATSIAPGADDDASGIATLTEILRAMVAKNYRPLRTIKMMAYAAEEVGLRGSAAIAANYQTAGVNVVGVVQFDMTNYKGSTQDIWLMQDFTNAAQNTFMQNLITTYVGATFSTDSCGYGCSDHASWHNRGYATSMPFESAMSQYNPNIHTSNDRLSVSGGNANHAIKFARLGVAYAAELAKGTLGTTPGNTPPTVSLTAPANGATVSGVITVSANASDSDGTVANVAFTMPNGSVVTDTTAPYSATFDTALVTNGAYTVRAVATDNAGAASTASQVSVTVQNGTPGCVNGTFNATGLPLAIPDNNATGITSNLSVTGSGTVASLALSLNITHPFRGDLVVTLVSPAGTQHSVSNRAGGSADNIVLTNSPITTFNGQTAAGTWQLRAVDAAGSDVGSLVSWSLTITGNCTPGNQAPTASITAPANGATVSGVVTVSANASDADGTVASVRFEMPNGTAVTDTTAPYSATFDTALVANGSRVFRAIATDNNGAASTAAQVTVTVQNTTGTCATGIFNATGLPMNIPDNNATGITSNLAIAGAGTVSSLSLSLNISHTYRGDLVVTLVSPAGTQYSVSNRSGGSADNIILTNSPVTAFNNQTTAGTWQLRVRDAANADIGALNSWSLNVTSSCPVPPPLR